MRPSRLRGAAILGIAGALAACDDRAPAPPSLADVPAPPGVPSAVASLVARGAEPAPTASAVASAAAARPLAGTWRGAFEAKKGSVALPAKVTDKAWAKDDGKAASGAGKVELELKPGGAVAGTITGALGPATLSGHYDETTVRATVVPDDPTAANAMTGVLVGLVREGAIAAEIRVAGPDATVVREAKAELERK